MSLPAAIISQIVHPPGSQPSVLGTIRIRSQVDDFIVEEIPAYVPSGSGEHGWLWIEKRGLSSPELVKRICTTLGVASTDVGIAGQKDRHAVTRQFVSLPKRFSERAGELNGHDLTVLTITAHTNKLKTGHLKGNRFRLVVRSDSSVFDAATVASLQERLLQLTSDGFPNYFGRQRFGHGGSTLNDGLRFLKGRLPDDHWPAHQSRTLQRLSLSAVQSAVFNLVLGQRVVDRTFATPLPGDVVIRREGIKPFRFPDGGDPAGLIPAGPMPGPEMLAAAGDIATIEAAAMEQLGVTDKDFRKYAKLTSGVRRKMAEFPDESSVELLADGSLALQFTLSAGTFATTLLENLAAEVIDATDQTAPVDSGAVVPAE